jgi:hypothetical protein
MYKYWPWVKKRRTLTYILGAICPQTPPNPSAWRRPNTGIVSNLKYKSNVWEASRPALGGGLSRIVEIEGSGLVQAHAKNLGKRPLGQSKDVENNTPYKTMKKTII